MKKILLLLLLVLLACGCSRAEKSEGTDPAPSAVSSGIRPDEEDGPEEFSAVEAGEEAEFPVFSSVEELTEAIRLSAGSGPPENGWSPEARVKLGSIARFPMLSEGSFPFYRLFRIEVLPDFLCFYYMPEESGAERFDAATGITVTVARKSAYTLESLAAQTGIGPDPDGFLRDDAKGELAFETGSGSSLTVVRVPSESFDLEKLRSKLEVREVEIPDAAEKKAHWGEFDLRVPEGSEEISRTGVYDEEEASVLNEVVFRYGEDVCTYRTQFTGRLKNISGFPDEFVRGEHDDMIPEETPRCYRSGERGVLLWLKDGRMFSLSMTEGAGGDKLPALYRILTEDAQP